ncbi:MAG: hypothetical protein J5542_08205 [Bacteroidales bacterium]|nr:hypothetical protein [Bacteroidales bacterium]
MFLRFFRRIVLAAACLTVAIASYSQSDIACGRPTIKFYNLQDEIFAGEASSFIARVLSFGYVDTLCALDYVIYCDEQKIERVNDYGTVSFSVRKSGNTFENVNVTEGSGRLGFRYLLFDVYAATLGVFDGYCPGAYDANNPNGGRNRPFTFNYRIDNYGLYRINLTISRCSNTGNDILQSFSSVPDAAGCCDDATHHDRTSGQCDNPVSIYECDIVFNVVSTKILTQPQGALVCAGESVPMSVVAQTNLETELQYQWYKDGEPLSGETSTDFVANDEGVYYCAIDDGREVRFSDEAVVAYRTVDVDTVRYICNGMDSLEIVLPECDSYLWQDGTTDASIVVEDAGTYHVTLTDYGCVFERDIVVSVSPDYDLIVDDSVAFCYNDSLQIELAASNLYDVVWNENPEYNQNPFVIRESGTYTVVAYEGGCPFADTLLAVRGENVNLVAEDTIRHCYPGLLVGLSVDNATNIVWCGGLVEGDSIYIGSGLEYYDVTADIAGCTYYDSFVNLGDAYPNTRLENNTYLYEIQDVDTVITIVANDDYDYLWGNGSTENYFAISCDTIELPYSEEVNYTVTSEMGCEYEGSFVLTIVRPVVVPDFECQAWSVAPNPSDGRFRIVGKEFDSAELYAADGRMICTVDDASCDFGYLSAGLYYIKVYSGEKFELIRISFVK